jgi:steroid delta-isomerase-like uncharacterized protein
MQGTQDRFITDLFAAWNSHDPAIAATPYAAEYEGVDIGQNAPLHGAAAMQEYFARFYAAFPDVVLTADDVVVSDDQYAIAWNARGTHLGKLMNIPPSGKAICVRGISLLTLHAGKVIRGQTVWDMAGLLRAIGLLPRLSR